MADDTDTRILNQVDKDRRIAFFKWENKMLKWAISAVIVSLGSAAAVVAQWDKIVDLPTVEVLQEKEETHKQVHEIQNQDRAHLEEVVMEVRTQQTIDAVKISNIETNVWAVLQEIKKLDK